MTKPIRVLQVLAQMNRGGAETMVMNLYRNIDRTKIQFDFVVHTNKECEFDNEIRKYGGIIYHVPRYTGKNHFSYINEWETLLGQHPEFRIIHGHVRSTAVVYLKVAKRHDMLTIAHSHSTSSDFHKIIKRILQYPIRYFVDYMFACSINAGEWLFGKKAVLSSRFHVMKNSVDVNVFEFRPKVREQLREDLDLDGKIVLGHVGRFNQVKNHQYILEVFAYVLKQYQNAVLLLIGDGERRKMVEFQAQEMGLNEKVRFLGSCSNVSQLMQAMDVFLFPSLFEGFPVTLVEAQAAGLPCVVSDTISKEVEITDLVEFVSLSMHPEEWAKIVMEKVMSTKRRDHSEEVKKAGYDVAENALWLQDFYLTRHMEATGNQT